MADETQVSGGEPEAQPDYQNESIEELEARLQAGEGLIDPNEPEAPQETEAPAAEEAVEPEGTDETPAEEEPTPQDTEQEPDERDLVLEEMRAQLRQTEAERRKQEFLASRNAGELGQVKRQLTSLQRALESPREPSPDAEDQGIEQAEPRMDVRPAQEPTSDFQSRVAELEDMERQRIINQELLSFVQANEIDHQSEEGNAVLQEMTPLVKQQMEQYEGLDIPPKQMQKLSRMVLDSAFASVTLSRVQKSREEALQKRASQVADRKKQKLAATSSGSGKPGVQPSRPKSVEDMTAEEADAEMERLYGNQRGRLRG